MNKETENQERLFEADQDRVDWELDQKLKQIDTHRQTPEWIELSSLLELVCGFTRFDANRVAADEILRRVKRGCIARVFLADIEGILNSIDSRDAERRCMVSDTQDVPDGEELEELPGD